MSASLKSHVGVMFRRENPPEVLPGFARRAEALGISELWVVEDCFYASGIASAAVALAVTDSIRVGLGIMPAVARNPAFTAMEIATLARIYPGRFIPGIGHGMADWMKQIGAFPKSQLAALSETSEVVRRLLAGELVTFHGEHVHLDNVKLEFPPTPIPPVLLGVRSTRSLVAAGCNADGAMLAEQASPPYVRWACGQIEQGQAEAGVSGTPYQVAVYMMYAVDDNGRNAVARMRPVLGEWLSYGNTPYTAALGIDSELNAMRQRGADLKTELPEAWIREMSITGTPDECAASIQRMLDAGAHQVILVPEKLGVVGLEDIEKVLDV